MSRLIGKQFEAIAMCVPGLAKAGEAVEKSCDPFDIASPDRISKVIEFNGQEAAHFAEILNRPPPPESRRTDRQVR